MTEQDLQPPDDLSLRSQQLWRSWHERHVMSDADARELHAALIQLDRGDAFLALARADVPQPHGTHWRGRGRAARREAEWRLGQLGRRLDRRDSLAALEWETSYLLRRLEHRTAVRA